VGAQLQRYADLGLDVANLQEPEGDGVLVLPHALVPVQELSTRLTLPGRTEPGIFDRNFEDPDRYHPVAPEVPVDRPYRVQGFEPGTQYRNIPPRDAVPDVLSRGRFPATIEEGLAVFVQHPEVLQRNACFSLAGSTRGDKRVPALWISGQAPKLGWCFAGAPHTWLGLASVGARLVD
jgi:hypothetical protein